MPRAEETSRGVLRGDRRSIARAITVVENGAADAKRLMALLFPHTGKAHIIGFTGSGGAGKSTLIEKVTREYLRKGQTVGVVAVDPTSPFTGGAFLGDRIRMQDLSTDERVFIRSMATRDHSGGIAKATRDAVRVLDAAGKNIVIVETVGAGQSEVEISNVAQTVVVVHAPGLGDEIQAIKAGIMEIADVFVVNKADRENADETVIDIRAILQLDDKEKSRTWKTPVLKTVALTGDGVRELVDKLEEHKQFLEGEHDRRTMLAAKAEAELVEAVKERAAEAILDGLRRDGKLDGLLQEIVERRMDPDSVADRILKRALSNVSS